MLATFPRIAYGFPVFDSLSALLHDRTQYRYATARTAPVPLRGLDIRERSFGHGYAAKHPK